MLWMGDLETAIQEKIKEKISLPSIDILFAPHHGRDSGTVPRMWMEQMSPNLVVIGEAPSEHLNYYTGYNTITQNSAGDIVLDCDTSKTHIYVSNKDYIADFLDDEGMPDAHGAHYIGTLQSKAAQKAKAAATR